MNTNCSVLPDGKHKGKPIEEVPYGYLKWMIRSKHSMAMIAEREVDYRLQRSPCFSVSSLMMTRILSKFCDYRIRNQKSIGKNFEQWIRDQAAESLKNGKGNGYGKYRYEGMVFIFVEDKILPELVGAVAPRIPIRRRRSLKRHK